MIIVYCINEKARADSVDLFCEEHYWIQIMTFIFTIAKWCVYFRLVEKSSMSTRAQNIDFIVEG